MQLDPAGPTKAEYGQAKLTVDVGNGELIYQNLWVRANLSGQGFYPETTEYIKQEQYIGKYGTLPHQCWSQ